MTEINPPRRRAINPPSRRAPPTIAPPARRASPSVWAVGEGAPPLAFGHKTHNAVKDIAGKVPDERFRPLLIVLDPFYEREPSPRTALLVKQVRGYKPEDIASLELFRVASFYIAEYILRDRIGSRMMDEAVYDAMREKIYERRDDRKSKDRLNPQQLSMFTFTDDGDVVVDFTKAAGPFYCEYVLEIEKHLPQVLQRVAP